MADNTWTGAIATEILAVIAIAIVIVTVITAVTVTEIEDSEAESGKEREITETMIATESVEPAGVISAAAGEPTRFSCIG